MAANPTVNMMTSMRASPIKGRRKRRSMINPRAKLPKSVRIKASQMGKFAQRGDPKARKIKAPMANSSPWAKLRTLDDLKIMTKPKAASAYRNPMDSP
jgi:hypothetical protein